MSDEPLCIPEGINGAIVFRHEREPRDRSGAECGVCGHPFGRLYDLGCPQCGTVP